MSRKPNSAKRGNLSQFGLIDIPDLDNEEPMDLSDDDIDLEAELAKLSGGGPKRNRPRKPAPVPASNLDAMITESLRDVPSDDDGSGDEDDPDLLNQLKALGIDDEPSAPPPRASRPAPPPPGLSTDSSTISLLQDRISNYSVAEKNAKDSGESGRARRFGRALKTLHDLLKQAQAGRQIKDEDIPPPVLVGQPAPPAVPPSALPSAPDEPLIDLGPSEEPSSVPQEPPSPPKRAAPPEPTPPPTESELSPEMQQGMQIIMQRQQQFKSAALSASRSGDKQLAIELLRTVKQFDLVVQAYRSGQEMDLGELPTPEQITTAFRSAKTEEQVQTAAEPAPAPEPEESVGLITASTVEEALRQRLGYFQQQEAKAKEEANSSKARRMGRIVKQYQDAVKHHAAGKPVATDELPTPPGYAPLPGSSAPLPAPTPRAPPTPQAPHRAAPAVSAGTRHEKQLQLLLLRQKQFKDAAIKEKTKGNIEQAKEYLRAAKGFDPVIEAARGGLLVDLKSLPLPPKAHADLEHTFDVVSASDCEPAEEASAVSLHDEDLMARLHQQLTSQLKLCLCNRDHNKAMGNIAEANRFEHLAVTVKQDLDVVTVAKSLGQNPPKFHYETRNFSMVQCNTDLNENDLELTIVRGIAFNVPNPKEIDTYVKFEFPYPQDAPVSDRTALVKDTNSPQFDAVFPLAIHRGQRPCLRVFKRHAIKLEVFSRGGWFRSDSLLGTATVKLAPLETQVTLHESFPLMEGRRAAGGSLEVRLRVRTPLLQSQIENTAHRWLIIDN